MKENTVLDKETLEKTEAVLKFFERSGSFYNFLFHNELFPAFYKSYLENSTTIRDEDYYKAGIKLRENEPLKYQELFKLLNTPNTKTRRIALILFLSENLSFVNYFNNHGEELDKHQKEALKAWAESKRESIAIKSGVSEILDFLEKYKEEKAKGNKELYDLVQKIINCIENKGKNIVFTKAEEKLLTSLSGLTFGLFSCIKKGGFSLGLLPPSLEYILAPVFEKYSKLFKSIEPLKTERTFKYSPKMALFRSAIREYNQSAKFTLQEIKEIKDTIPANILDYAEMLPKNITEVLEQSGFEYPLRTRASNFLTGLISSKSKAVINESRPIGEVSNQNKSEEKEKKLVEVKVVNENTENLNQNQLSQPTKAVISEPLPIVEVSNQNNSEEKLGEAKVIIDNTENLNMNQVTKLEAFPEYLERVWAQKYEGRTEEYQEKTLGEISVNRIKANATSDIDRIFNDFPIPEGMAALVEELDVILQSKDNIDDAVVKFIEEKIFPSIFTVLLDDQSGYLKNEVVLALKAKYENYAAWGNKHTIPKIESIILHSYFVNIIGVNMWNAFNEKYNQNPPEKISVFLSKINKPDDAEDAFSRSYIAENIQKWKKPEPTTAEVLANEIFSSGFSSHNYAKAEKDGNRLSLFIKKVEVLVPGDSALTLMKEKGIIGIYIEHIQDKEIVLHAALNNHQDSLYSFAAFIKTAIMVKGMEKYKDEPELFQRFMSFFGAELKNQIRIDPIENEPNLYRYTFESVHPETKEIVYSGSVELLHNVEEKTIAYQNAKIILGKTAEDLGVSEDDLNSVIQDMKKTYPIAEANNINFDELSHIDKVNYIIYYYMPDDSKVSQSLKEKLYSKRNPAEKLQILEEAFLAIKSIEPLQEEYIKILKAQYVEVAKQNIYNVAVKVEIDKIGGLLDYGSKGLSGKTAERDELETKQEYVNVVNKKMTENISSKTGYFVHGESHVEKVSLETVTANSSLSLLSNGEFFAIPGNAKSVVNSENGEIIDVTFTNTALQNLYENEVAFVENNKEKNKEILTALVKKAKSEEKPESLYQFYKAQAKAILEDEGGLKSKLRAKLVDYPKFLKEFFLEANHFLGQHKNMDTEFYNDTEFLKNIMEIERELGIKDEERIKSVAHNVLSNSVTPFDKMVIEKTTKPYLETRESFGDSFPEYLNTVMDAKKPGEEFTYSDAFKTKLINAPYDIGRVFNEFPEFKDDEFVSEINAKLFSIISHDGIMNENGEISSEEVKTSLNKVYSTIYLRAFEALVDPDTNRLKPAIIKLLKQKFQSNYDTWVQKGYTDEVIEKAIFESYITNMMPQFGSDLGQNYQVYNMPYRVFRTDVDKLTFKELKQKCTDNLVQAYQLPEIVNVSSTLSSADEATRVLCLHAMIEEVKAHPTTYEKNRNKYEHFKDRTEKGYLSYDNVLLQAFTLAAKASDKSGKRDALSHTIVKNTIDDATADLGFFDRNFGASADKRNVHRKVIRNTPLNAITKIVNEISQSTDENKDEKIKEIVSIALSKDDYNLKFIPNPKGVFAKTVIEIAKEEPSFLVRAFNWVFNPSAYNRYENAVILVNEYDLKKHESSVAIMDGLPPITIPSSGALSQAAQNLEQGIKETKEKIQQLEERVELKTAATKNVEEEKGKQESVATEESTSPESKISASKIQEPRGKLGL